MRTGQSAASRSTSRPILASVCSGGSRRARVAALARAYLDFAARNPAVYDAIFQLDGGLAYAREDTPEPLKDAFAALRRRAT